LINKSHYYVDDWEDTRFRNVKAALRNANKATALDMREYRYNRDVIQQTVMQCMASMGLDAVTYPTGNIPAASSRRRSSPT
jgi:amidase